MATCNRRFRRVHVVAALVVPLCLLPLFALAYTRETVRRMVATDYGTDDVEMEFSHIGWGRHVKLYVEYRASVPNDGTFVPAVPRMTTLAAWYANP